MDIRYAAEDDNLQSIWKACFDNDDGRFFFPYEYHPKRALVAFDENSGAVLGALHYTLKTMRAGDEAVTCAYTLGVGVLPEHSGKGYGGELMEQLLFELHLRRIPFCFLLPGHPSLAPYYARFGFYQAGVLQPPPDGPALPFAEQPDFLELNRLYETMCANVLHPARTLEDWAAIAREYRICTGEGRYQVLDGSAAAEDSQAPFVRSKRAACVKIIEAKIFQDLDMLPRRLTDRFCRWNDSGGDITPEQAMFEGRLFYANLLHN